MVRASWARPTAQHNKSPERSSPKEKETTWVDMTKDQDEAVALIKEKQATRQKSSKESHNQG